MVFRSLFQENIQLIVAAFALTQLAIPSAKSAVEESAKRASVKSSLKEQKAMLDPRSQSDSSVSEYLLKMHSPTQLYLKIMLQLIGQDPSPVQNAVYDKTIRQAVERLSSELAEIKPPMEVAKEHADLLSSLGAVTTFLKDGGTAQGFRFALDLAHQMQTVSGDYHEEVLAMMRRHGACCTDPFLASSTSQKPQRRGDSVPINGLNLNRGSLTSQGSTDFDSGMSRLSKSNSGVSTNMVNGVDGSLGMSGLFNGLGGTGTNGLVDGLGFSSGLNGFVDGAGVSSGMSGMLNDTTGGTGASTPGGF